MQVSEAITRKSASNLALAFVLLPREKRQEMAALYAFCREVDDIADDESTPVEVRAAKLEAWRGDVRKACDGGQPQFAVNRELQPVIQRRGLRFEHFDELLKGVEMDLEKRDYATLEELELYCYRVASVVGLLSIEIFGYTNPACRDYAVYLGKALQFTNILRDVRNDAERGRVYLPLELCERFGVKPGDILAGRYDANYVRLAQDMADRAKGFYQKATETLPPADRRSMATAELMGSVYWKLLRKIEQRRFNVFEPGETRLNKVQKLFLVMRMWYRVWRGKLLLPNYGVG
ncbi:MAG TPA: presqualene diphosphate synthase HpnD [Verrucomicrobiae bacterium]